MKIKDRLMLGFLAGIGGNLVKRNIMKAACYLKWAEFDGPEKAAGLLLPAWKVSTPRGRIIGNICDFTIASLFGTVGVYLLSLTGKDHAVIKGGFFGEAAWSFTYGALGKMGLSSVRISSPKTTLSQCAAHMAYGMTAAWLITTFGDDGLFTGKIPLTSANLKQLGQKPYTGRENHQEDM